MVVGEYYSVPKGVAPVGSIAAVQGAPVGKPALQATWTARRPRLEADIDGFASSGSSVAPSP